MIADKLGERVQRAQDLADDDGDALVAAERLREQAAGVFVEMGRWWAQRSMRVTSTARTASVERGYRCQVVKFSQTVSMT